MRSWSNRYEPTRKDWIHHLANFRLLEWDKDWMPSSFSAPYCWNGKSLSDFPADNFNSICSVVDGDVSTTQSISAPYKRRCWPTVERKTPVNCFKGFNVSVGTWSIERSDKRKRLISIEAVYFSWHVLRIYDHKNKMLGARVSFFVHLWSDFLWHIHIKNRHSCIWSQPIANRNVFRKWKT